MRNSILTWITVLLVGFIAWQSHRSDTGMPAHFGQRLNQEIPPTSHAVQGLFVQNIFFKFMLEASGKSDPEKLRNLEQVQTYLQDFANQKKQMVQVSTLEELEQYKRFYLTNGITLREELDHRLKAGPPPYFIIEARTDEVARALTELENIQNQRAQELASALPIVPGTNASSLMQRVLISSARGTPQGMQLINAIPSAQRLFLVNQFENYFNKSFKEIENTGSFIANSQEMQLSDKSMQIFFQLLLNEYYQRMTLDARKDIVSAIIDHPEADTNFARFELMVLNSGPQFQKLFQIYAREPGFSDKLKTVFKRLEQNTTPVPWRVFKEQVMAQPVPFKWIKISEKPLGVGTMAQVHAAEIERPDKRREKIVVRLIKPGVRERLEMDNHILHDLAPILDSHPTLQAENFPKLAPFVEELRDMALRETNVPQTTKNQMRAAEVYNVEIRLHSGTRVILNVPKTELIPGSGDLMIQEFAPGTSFETFQTKEPALAREAVQELARKWLGEALFGSGFFHADLHQGNIRVSSQGKTVTLNLLDYGMTGQITEQLQNQFLAFGILAATQDIDLLTRAMWEMSQKEKNRLNLDEFRSLVAGEVARHQRAGVNRYPFSQWIIYATNLGLEFPSELVALNRGIVLMDRLLQDNGSSLTMGSIMKGTLIKNAAKLVKAIRADKSASRKDWIKIFWKQLRTKDVEYSELRRLLAASDAELAATQPSTGRLCSEMFVARKR